MEDIRISSYVEFTKRLAWDEIFKEAHPVDSRDPHGIAIPPSTISYRFFDKLMFETEHGGESVLLRSGPVNFSRVYMPEWVACS